MGMGDTMTATAVRPFRLGKRSVR